MIEDLLDFPEEERRLHRRRLFNRTRLSLLVLALSLCLANVLFIFITIPMSTPVISPEAFAGWSARYLLSGTMVLLAPALCFLAGSLLAVIPIKAYAYSQRTVIAFLVLCIVIEVIGLYQLITDYWASH